MNVDIMLDNSELENKNKLDNKIEIISLVDECIIQQLECHCCLTNENLLTCRLENCNYILCKTCWLRCKKNNNLCPCCRRDIKDNFCIYDSDFSNDAYNADEDSDYGHDNSVDSDDDWEVDSASRNNRMKTCGNCGSKCCCRSSFQRKIFFDCCLKKYADFLYGLAFLGIIITFLTLGRFIYLLIFCDSHNSNHDDGLSHCKNGLAGNDIGVFILTGLIGFFLGALILLFSCIFLSFACHDE